MPATPRFGFSGLCLLVGVVTFAIQQGCSVTGVSASWAWGALWFVVAISLVILAIWSWDATASHHWVRKAIMSVLMVCLMSYFSYIPISQQYRREHKPIVGLHSDSDTRQPRLDIPANKATPAPVSPPVGNKPRSTPEGDKVSLIFKSSPVWDGKNSFRKERISTNIGRLRRYLSSLDIPIPSLTPPIEAGQFGGTAWMSLPQSDIFAYHIGIRREQIDDKLPTTWSYCSYVISRFLQAYGERHSGRIPMDPSDLQRGLGADVITDYLNWSFWDQVPTTEVLPPWAIALWDLRAQSGKDRTDKLVAYTLRAYNEAAISADSEAHPDDVYLLDKIKDADALLNGNETRQLPLILQIWRKHGLSVQ